jgi:hypothetical protein
MTDDETGEYRDYTWIMSSATQGPTQSSSTQGPAQSTSAEYQTVGNYDANLDQDARNKILTLQIKDLRNQTKELKRALKMHIDNCPYSSIQVKK